MKRPFHYVLGITPEESTELRKTLESGELNGIYCWNGMTNVRRLLKSILYHSDLSKKAERFVEFLVMHGGRHGIPIPLYERLMDVRSKAETRWLFMMQDRDPSSIRTRKPLSECRSGYRRWSPNKANYAKLVDDFACEYAKTVFPDDRDLAARVSANRAKWAAKRMPGERKRKPGPKPKGGAR